MAMTNQLGLPAALFAPVTLLELSGPLGGFALLSRFVVATLTFGRRLGRVSRSRRRVGACLPDMSVVWRPWRGV